MALIVEDGTGLSTAESFVSVANADTYHDGRGNTDWTDANTTQKEEALRRASSYLTDRYRWQGLPYNGRTQALAWPRKGILDEEGYDVDETEIPEEVKRATYELALLELGTPGYLSPVVVVSDKVKREKVGSLEVEYVTASVSPMASQPVILIVDALIGQFLCMGGSALSGETFR